MEVISDKIKTDDIVDRIHKNEYELAWMNSLYSKILRRNTKDKEMKAEKLKNELIDDMKRISENKKMAFRYVESLMTDPIRQFQIGKLDKLYGKGFSDHFSVIESFGNYIRDQDQFASILQMPIYVCKSVPETQENIDNAFFIVRFALDGLSNEIQ